RTGQRSAVRILQSHLSSDVFDHIRRIVMDQHEAPHAPVGSGMVRLPKDVPAANSVWVAAVAYDEFSRVVGLRRWESAKRIVPGGSLRFAFAVSSLAGEIERVEFVVEARP
ncbi:MAG: hypothetical protein WBL25_08525, partial [Anaerolineales bacterium]